MIVDSSALIAILRQEPERPRFLDRLASIDECVRISAANLLEAAIVADGTHDPEFSNQFDAIVADFTIEIAPVTAEHAHLAREAYRRFGKGNHRARLNFGDCFAYALSKATGEPLLFKGDDFTHTDVVPALT